MNLKVFISTLLLFFATYSVLAQNKYNQKIDGIMSIDFPSKPLSVENTYESEYYLDTKEYNRYDFLIVKLDSTLGTPTLANLDIVYKGFIDGVLNKFKGNLISQKNIEKGGLKGVELELTTLINNGISYNIFIRAFLINKKIYNASFCCMTVNKIRFISDKDNYFNSFKILVPENTIIQYKLDSKGGFKNLLFLITQALIGFFLLGGIAYAFSKLVKWVINLLK